MTDLSLTLTIPEDLLERAKMAQVDIRQTLIEALERKVQQSQPSAINRMPTRAEIEASIETSKQRNASGHYPKREFSYLKGEHWLSDDFDDELPDEFWFGDDQ